MPDVAEHIKTLNEIDFPPGLHGKIMRKLAFLQFRTPFVVVVGLLLLNLLFSGWQIYLRLADTDAFATFRILLQNIDFNWRSLSDLFQVAENLFPVGLMISFLLNVLLIIYLLYVVKTFRTFAPSKKPLD